MPVTEAQLGLVKQEVLSDLKTVVKRLDTEELSAFNRGYLHYREDPYKRFVLAELTCWDKVIAFYAYQRNDNCKGILDIGTFIPYYPVVLKKIGYHIEVVEKISLYGKSYDPILDYLSLQDIKIHNVNVIKDPLDSLPVGWDILLIAILEHLNGTPRMLIDKIKSLMNSDSLLYIHVPNICKLPNVIDLLRGRSILPSYNDYFFSDYPFEGHNREMTLEELLSLCKLSSLEVVKKGRLIKSNRFTIRSRIYNVIKQFIPKYSDSVYIIAKKSRGK